MRVESKIYAVADDDPDVSDESWYEYRVTLIRDGEKITTWDSKIETYNGVKSQRLSEESAEEAVEEIREDVADGKADLWFKIPSGFEIPKDLT